MIKHSFKDNSIIYNENNEIIENIYAFKNLYISANDICKLFKFNTFDLDRVLRIIFAQYLKETDVEYNYIDENRSVIKYYSLDVIISLSVIRPNMEALKYLLWANNSLRNILIKEKREVKVITDYSKLETFSIDYHHTNEYYINKIYESSIDNDDINDIYNEEIMRSFQKRN